MNCEICASEPVVMCRPYDSFTTRQFGRFDDEGVRLCAECNQLWEWHHFGSLANRLTRQHNSVYRGFYVNVSDMYHLLCQLEVITRAKLN